MKKKYLEVEISICSLNCNDIVTLSTGETETDDWASSPAWGALSF